MRVAALCLRAETPGVAPVSVAYARPTSGQAVWTRRLVAPDARSAGALIWDLQPPEL